MNAQSMLFSSEPNAFAPLVGSLALIMLLISLRNPRTRRWAFRLLVAAFGLSMVAWLVFAMRSQATNSATIVSQNSFEAADLVGGKSTPRSTKIATDQPLTTSAPSENENRSSWPDWMKQPPSKKGDVYVLPVESGVYTDPSIRQQMLEAKMVAAANRYTDELLYRQGGGADTIALDPDYLNSFVRARATSSDGNETFVRLELDQHFRDEVDRRYQSFLSLGRLEQLTGGAAAAIIVLGLLYSYLRFTQPRTPAASTPVPASAKAV